MPAQLGVSVDVDETDLKKAYRKQAMKVRLAFPLTRSSGPLLIANLTLRIYSFIHAWTM